jgi:hypothetical protein
MAMDVSSRGRAGRDWTDGIAIEKSGLLTKWTPCDRFLFDEALKAF